MKIQIQCLSFLELGKVFWLSYYLHHSQEKENGIQPMCRPVPERLFWDFPTAYKRGRNRSLMTAGCPILLIHSSIVPMWLVFHSSIAFKTDFNFITENHVFFVTPNFLGKHMPVNRRIPYGHNSFFSRTIVYSTNTEKSVNRRIPYGHNSFFSRTIVYSTNTEKSS